MLHSLMNHLLNPVAYMVPVLLPVALLTLFARKLLGLMQLRMGPSVVGPYGLLLPIADGVNLLIKEPVRPSTSSRFLFLATSILAVTLAMTLWAPMRIPYPVIGPNLWVLLILGMSSLAVYSILGSRCASNSKYALIGALRAVAQKISYEVSLGLILVSVIIFSGGYTLQSFSTAQESISLLAPAWPLGAMCYISTLAETNRARLDLTDGESELVSGFIVEYGGGPLAMFLLAVYASIPLLKTLSAVLYSGESLMHHFPELTTNSLMSKAALLSIVFLWVRASYPRFRLDLLKHLVWKNILPFTVALVLRHVGLPMASAGLPPQF
uniref:NADH-ubiquinone oxidoreductase chain 1 n=1 Tax=Hemiculter bleekeri TaxID=198511 RepID=A0A142G901_9TELE|nr:NADH dehydrogenase subunit 1 [Hemiculter bleekeri]AMR00350.1 NADH dehydrogenase subunit 1 [Hemiculter bleekeri]